MTWLIAVLLVALVTFFVAWSLARTGNDARNFRKQARRWLLRPRCQPNVMWVGRDNRVHVELWMCGEAICRCWGRGRRNA